MTVGSLFAGIGGFDLGFERAGFEIKWQVEIDPFCRAVLAKHWPDVRRYEDVRTVGVELEHVDVICGGFPCQDISVAGAGAGIDGERSGLWSQYARLISELRPRYVVVENVSALLGRGLGRVLGDLASRGYDAEWDCLPASAFGAPHRRDRVWIIAYPGDGGQRQLLQSVSELGRGTAADARCDGETWTMADVDDQRQLQPQGCECDERRRARDGRANVANTTSGRGQRWWAVSESAPTGRALGLSARPDETGGGQWATEPDVGRVAYGVSARVDRLRGLGNAIVPQIAEWIARRILEAEAA